MDCNGPSNSQVQRIWKHNMEDAIYNATRRRHDVTKTAKRIQALFQDRNACVKGNWVLPNLEEIIEILES